MNYSPVLESTNTQLFILCIACLVLCIQTTRSNQETNSGSSSQHANLLSLSYHQYYVPSCPVYISQHSPGPIPKNISGPIPSFDHSTSTQYASALSLTKSRLNSSYLSSTSSTRPKSVSISSRIIGGRPVNTQLSNYLALLYIIELGETRGLCTATIVGPRLLITAAHCVINFGSATNYLKVMFGAKSSNKAKGLRYRIKSISSHPLYDDEDYNSFGNDIGYIRLFKKVPAYSKFMKVNTNHNVPEYGSVVRAAGYGVHHYFNNRDLPDTKLYQVDVPVGNFSYCKKAYKKMFINVSKYDRVCAGYENGGCGVCYGDSGGPLFQYDDEDEPVLVGITSIGSECDLLKVPSAYARVSRHVYNFLPFKNLSLSNNTNPLFLSRNQLKSPFAETEPLSEDDATESTEPRIPEDDENEEEEGPPRFTPENSYIPVEPSIIQVVTEQPQTSQDLESTENETTELSISIEPSVSQIPKAADFSPEPESSLLPSSIEEENENESETSDELDEKESTVASTAAIFGFLIPLLLFVTLVVIFIFR